MAAYSTHTMCFDQLKKAFSQAYPDSGTPSVCRAPGRVNLLGEHLDYNGLPVLPSTIDREIAIAFCPRKGGVIRLRDVDTRYPDVEFANAPDIPASPAGSWENYCKAAVQGLNRHCELDCSVGMDLLVAGTIPPAAGLSSSSALVVASALAYLAAAGLTLGGNISRIELAALLAEAEHYVGTQGGGMDQAVILLGETGKACKIDFNPLRIETVPIFRDYSFVVCHSLVFADKTGSARVRYNEGPLSCRLLRAMVERQAQRTFGDEVQIARLADLWFGPLCLLDSEVEALFRETFPHPRTSLEDAARFLGVTVETIRERWIGDLPEPDGGFPLQARARHQLSEYQRVESGRDLLIEHDPLGFGELMNASHASCATDYKVSCPELDRLVQVSRRAGSAGSRLTGAGFGGCTVNLVPTQRVPDFCRTLKREYYAEFSAPPTFALTPEDQQLLVVPSQGASHI
ncbi:MAG: galactokinase [Candidatus Hydrogenedentes bacterium]|nr:galactokinase [Candidatus Hydrogenedentota bacterium]